MNIRERREMMESETMAPWATLCKNSEGRPVKEEPCDMRTAFQRDRDRIIHCKSFRRLKHKTQVFLCPEGDHYRTRLTHTLEVSQIARTISRALFLNEDLTEAISMGHDLGHTPFGHAGERVLRELCSKGFEHNVHSLRIVDCLELDGKGLNLSNEVRDGILNHTGENTAKTPEGQLVKLADRIAYINHDIDDAIRADILIENDLPFNLRYILGRSHSERINTMITAIVNYSEERQAIGMEPEIYKATMELRSFLFDSVYTNPIAKGEESKATDIIRRIYDYFMNNAGRLPDEYKVNIEENGICGIDSIDAIETAVCDYIAGMSDSYSIKVFMDLFVPKFWQF